MQTRSLNEKLHIYADNGCSIAIFTVSYCCQNCRYWCWRTYAV